jgi:hypothetical protein
MKSSMLFAFVAGAVMMALFFQSAPGFAVAFKFAEAVAGPSMMSKE